MFLGRVGANRGARGRGADFGLTSDDLRVTRFRLALGVVGDSRVGSGFGCVLHCTIMIFSFIMLSIHDGQGLPRERAET